MENTSQVRSPSGEHIYTIILLHGRDSSASVFAEEFLESEVSDDYASMNGASNDRTLPGMYPTVKWVFPTSKWRPSARFGESMSQWFDMWSVENHWEKVELQIDGLRESVKETLDIIRHESTLVSPHRIILGGISQGCATAIHALLCGDVQLGGFIGLSSWLPFQPESTATLRDLMIWRKVGDRLHYSAEMLSPLNDQAMTAYASEDELSLALNTPVFLSHSQDDEIVPIANGKSCSTTLESLGMTVRWFEYEDGGHWVNEPQGVDDMAAFIRMVMESSSTPKR